MYKNKDTMDLLTRCSDYIIKKLDENGIIMQKYISYTTNSIYIKLDYGVINSLRISDHKGKKHLAYRYNILTKCGNGHRYSYKTQDGYERFFLPMHEVDVLIAKILYDRNKKMNMYGESTYKLYMERNQEKNKNKKGFWQQAELVTVTKEENQI